jgi:hypothetical protein
LACRRRSGAARNASPAAAISSFAWQVSPFCGTWLERNTSRLTNGPQLAVLGYGLTHFGHDAGTDAITLLITGSA